MTQTTTIYERLIEILDQLPVLGRGRPRIAARERLKVNGDCIDWIGATSDGYGILWAHGRFFGAHKFFWEAMNGPVPAGLELDHLCRNRSCVNPLHLEPVTRLENIRRGIVGAHNRAKTTCPCGRAYDYVDSRGKRGCRACRLEASRRFRERKTISNV